ncbi:MAG TPA: protease pro-enzyme activation domain-containing protein [Verrucomicrobiae bacterium]|nr:protease pro-enzyme activation domain-containing protein [Verrucomicrobiae bacterium]
MKGAIVSHGFITIMRFLSSRAGLSFAGILLCVVQQAHAERQILHGHIPAIAPSLQPLADLEASNRLDLTIGLPLRNHDSLVLLLHQLYDPASTNYRHYLTPAQFTAQFGPTTQDYQTVIAFARSNNLAVTGTHPNRALLDVQGSVADIERTFRVHLRTYKHPVEPRAFYAPDTEPSVDLATPLLGITGLNNYVIPHPQSLFARPMNKATPRSGSGSFGTYLGGDFRAAYVPGTPLTGAGQSIGLFELDAFYPADITNYEKFAGYSNVPLSTVSVDGFNGPPKGGNVEVALDIEMAVSMAPGLSSVIIYEGTSKNNITVPNLVLSRMADDDSANQLSCSWGFTIDSQTDTIFQQFAAQGQSFFLASGDTGAFTGSIPPPSDDPYVTVVGGTTLSTSGPGGSWTSEKVWNWYLTGQGDGASSGGISTTYTIPSWQSSVSMAANQGSSTMRNLPDVALTADNVWAVYSNGFSGELGGTSCAAPLWAGLLALANQQGASNGQASVGFVNPSIYTIGLSGAYTGAFHDITNGNNTTPSSRNKFYAVPGYDLCTGWGTPAGNNLINLLLGAPLIDGQMTLLSETCSPTNDAIDPGETVTINLALTNLFPTATSNLVATLLPSADILSPSGPQTYGIVAVSNPPVSQPFTFTAQGDCGQMITAVWQLQDGAANLGVVQINFALGQLISTNDFAENFDELTATALPTNWSTSISGSQVDWVTTAASADTPPNSAFATDATTAGVACLVSPSISILTTNAQLTFRQNYNLESASVHHFSGNVTTYYDGGVLDIQINDGGFEDILSAGGSFVNGGYVGTLYTGSGNPLAGRQAWSGNSGGWTTTTVTLPAKAVGQTIQLRWDCATDTGNSSSVAGWYVDTIFIHDGYYLCCNDNRDLPATLNAATATVGVAGFSIAVQSVASVMYALQYKNVLTDPQWMLLPGSIVQGTGGVITLQDTTTPQITRFYRAVSNQ